MKQRGGFLDRILHEADEDIENFLCWQTRALPKLRKPSIIPTTHLADSTNRLHNRQQKTVIKRVNSAQSIDSLQSSGSWKSKVKQPTETASLPGRLWASGLNIAQQLGTRHHNDCLKFQPVKFCKRAEENKKFLVDCKLIAAGAMTSYAVDKHGNLWSWGSDDDGALGPLLQSELQIDLDASDYPPTMVKLPPSIADKQDSIKQIVAGSSFAALLTDGGRVYVWGSLINEDTGEKFRLPNCLSRVKLAHRAEKITAGNNHLLILCGNNRVMAMGWNGCGQLSSIKSETFIIQPVDITTQILPHMHSVKDCQTRVSNIFAAANSSWVEVEVRRGRASVVYQYFAFGSNTHGQLGIGMISTEAKEDNNARIKRRLAFVSQPCKVKELSDKGRRVTQLAAGMDFSVFLLDDGSVWCCGRGDFGQLGIKEAYLHSIEHSGKAFIAARPKRVTCHPGDLNWLGNHLQSTQLVPCKRERLSVAKSLCERLKPIERVQHIAAGSRSVLCVTEGGQLLSWGDNYSGQLGLGGSDDDGSNNCTPLFPGLFLPTPIPFKTVNRCMAISVGSNHSLIVAI